jgi:uncharacterized surface protein with fasciclin (FAS1) repeats
MKALNINIYLLLCVCVLNSCDEFEYTPAAPYANKFDLTFNEFVVQRFDSLEMFNQALNITGIEQTIETSEYTIFAPYNSGIKEYLNTNGYATLEDVPVDELTDLVLNHIMETRKISLDFTHSEQEYQALNGESLSVSITGDTGNLRSAYVILVDGRTVLTSNIELQNVIVHAYQGSLL